MKKHARRSSTIHLENNHQGCMWSILHILNYHQWRHVKKRLPYRRHGRGRNSSGVTNSGSGSDCHSPEQSQEHNDARSESSSQVNEKKTRFVSINKSVKARLKALIIEEKSRRKRHHQSNSCPVHLQSAPVPLSDQSESRERYSGNDQTLLHDGASPRGLPQKSRSGNFAAPSDESKTSNRLEDHPESSSRQKFLQKGLSVDVPVYKAEGVLDAFGLVNITEESLQKILHDRRTFLLQRFHSQKHFSTKIGLQRLGTFPSPKPTNEVAGSVDAHDHDVSDVKFTPVPLPRLQDRSSNPEAVRRFMDIRQKIKHATRTNRKEKQRLVMDGVLDKIPSDQNVSEGKKEELVKKWRECVINKDYQDRGRSKAKHEHKKKHFKRTSSLDHSMDKYCQLFEASFKREAKNRKSESFKVQEKEEAGSHAETKTKMLGRILSLPDMNSYSFQSEDSCSDVASLEAPNRADSPGAFNRGSSFDSTTCPGSQHQSQLDAQFEGDQNEEKPAEKTESTTAEIPNIAKVSATIEPDSHIDLTAKSSGGAEEPSPVSVFDVNSQEIIPSYETLPISKDLELHPGGPEVDALGSSPGKHQEDPSMDKPMEPTDKIDLECTELQEGGPLEDFLQFQVVIHDVELFNCVRDVLELSGLTGPEASEVWHSDYQPVSPTVYEEVSGCQLMDPECSGIEEAADCDHLLLFDLINEVLVDIYQRSLNYWPEPLSKHCRVHRMPVGTHLLKEVWANISTYLAFRPELDPTLDYVVSKDLEKRGGWMDLQFESECVGIELEELIFDDLLEELLLLYVLH